MISLGHALFEFALVVLLFLGIGKYLSTIFAQILIGLIGGIVLLFSGFSMTKDAYVGKISIEIKDKAGRNNGNILIGGIIISATNPYLLVWWAAVGLGLD